MTLPVTADRGRHRAAGGRRRVGGLGLGAAAFLLAAAVASQAASAAVPEGSIRDAGTDGVVPNSYVVALKDTGALTASGVDSSAQALASRYSGQVARTYSHALRGFEVRLSEANARRLAADSAVAYVQRNGMSSRTTARSCGAGSHIMDGREAMAVTDEENHSVLAGLQPFEWSDEPDSWFASALVATSRWWIASRR